jgi:hypothetical protein
LKLLTIVLGNKRQLRALLGRNSGIFLPNFLPIRPAKNPPSIRTAPVETVTAQHIRLP